MQKREEWTNKNTKTGAKTTANKHYLPRILPERMQTVDPCQRVHAGRQFCPEIYPQFVEYQPATTRQCHSKLFTF